MGLYRYKARDDFGKLISGRMSADSGEAVAQRLKESGYLPVAIREVKGPGKISKFLDRFQGVKLSEVNMFTRQFATLQKAAVPIIQSLEALKEQISNRNMKYAIAKIETEVNEGNSLSSAMSKFPKIFDSLYVNTIMVGEKGGELSETLLRLASLGEHAEKMRMRIKIATRYPLMVVIAIGIAFVVLTIVVVPRFAKVYSAAEAELPLPTQFMIWMNYALTRYWWILSAAIAGIVIFFHKAINTAKGREWWDGLKLKFPIFGELMLKVAMSRFSKVTGVLMRSGVPLLSILELVSDGADNVVIARAIDNIRIGVKRGNSMSEIMKMNEMFPSIVIQMVAVGERTGTLDELLLGVSDYYDSQVDYMIDNFTSLIEPLLLFVLGGAVLIMALGIFLPMWSLMDLFSG